MGASGKSGTLPAPRRAGPTGASWWVGCARPAEAPGPWPVVPRSGRAATPFAPALRRVMSLAPCRCRHRAPAGNAPYGGRHSKTHTVTILLLYGGHVVFKTEFGLFPARLRRVISARIGPAPRQANTKATQDREPGRAAVPSDTLTFKTPHSEPVRRAPETRCIIAPGAADGNRRSEGATGGDESAFRAPEFRPSGPA